MISFVTAKLLEPKYRAKELGRPGVCDSLMTKMVVKEPAADAPTTKRRMT